MIAWLQRLFSRRLREYARLDRKALPDGTRVILVCQCSSRSHDGIWRTSWTPRRMGQGNDLDWPDDYLLTNELDGRTTYATRGAIEVVP